MAFVRPAVLLAVLMLGGCGPLVDDPANIPLRGRWQRETKLLSFVVNDVWVDRRKSPINLPDDETVVRSCIEPALKSSDQINNDLFRGKASMCRFGALERHGGATSAEGKCASTELAGGTISGTMDFTGRETSDTAAGKVSATLMFKTPAGASDRVRFGVETRWKRLGDCGS